MPLSALAERLGRSSAGPPEASLAPSATDGTLSVGVTPSAARPAVVALRWRLPAHRRARRLRPASAPPAAAPGRHARHRRTADRRVVGHRRYGSRCVSTSSRIGSSLPRVGSYSSHSCCSRRRRIAIAAAPATAPARAGRSSRTRPGGSSASGGLHVLRLGLPVAAACLRGPSAVTACRPPRPRLAMPGPAARVRRPWRQAARRAVAHHAAVGATAPRAAWTRGPTVAPAPFAAYVAACLR